MRSIIFAASLLLLYFPGNKNDLAKQRLRGRVKSVTDCQCPMKKNGKTDSNGCSVFVFKYGDNGNQYEDNDYLNGSIYKGFGELNHKRLYKYDERGNQSEGDEYNPDGSINQRVMYRYDEKGNRVERDNFLRDGTLWHRSLYTFDDSGRQVECSRYDADSALTEHYSYAYDAHGNLAMEQHVVIKPKERNAGHKKITFTPPNAERRVDYIKTFSYNENGEIISETNYVSGFSQPFETTYGYEQYDSLGNWLRQTAYQNGHPVGIAERVIEYY